MAHITEINATPTLEPLVNEPNQIVKPSPKTILATGTNIQIRQDIRSLLGFLELICNIQSPIRPSNRIIHYISI
jgi:hypothetical protein